MKIKMISIVLICLTSCNSIKDKIGLSRTIPNEKEVKILSPLVVPPHFDLPEPENNAHVVEPKYTNETSARNIPAPK